MDLGGDVLDGAWWRFQVAQAVAESFDYDHLVAVEFPDQMTEFGDR